MKMRIIRSLGGLRSWRRKQDGAKGKIGFVPTMGALHEGHLSLIRKASKQGQHVVVSIFVNPLQFGPAEDLGRYPRPIKDDEQLCREAGVALLFWPSSEDFYPKDFQTSVTVNQLSRRWEGESRPTHFEGVTTVVTKLLTLVRPHKAYFGQKDYQQLLVIQQLVKDLNLDTKIVPCPTIREADGLALSSRNRYLSERQRQRAVSLSTALEEGLRAIKEGVKNAQVIQNHMKIMLRTFSGVTVEYLSVCDAKTLEPIQNIVDDVVLLGAIQIDNIRLIDNLLITMSPRIKAV